MLISTTTQKHIGTTESGKTTESCGTIKPETGHAPYTTREYNIGNKKFIVKSVFVGSQDIQTSLLNLAERKAIREMGLDMPLYQGS